MVFDPESVRGFGWNIQRLINGEHLSREESYAMFRAVLLDQQPELQQGAFLAALVAKGETPQEIAGAWQAIDEVDTVHTTAEFAAPVIENSGTGMDRLKTFNVSSAAAIIAAANGVTIARHGARALTSRCGAVDVLEAVGVNVECDVPAVERSIQRAGIGLFNGMSARVHPRALFRILSQIRFGSTLNIAASLASPARPSLALRGVYSERLVETAAAVMKEIGYRRAMIVHGFDADRERGMDELSTLGETVVREFFPDGREEQYTLRPEDVGLDRACHDEIAPAETVAEESIRFLRVIAGRGSRACADLACLNAAAILRVHGSVSDLMKGVALCRETIESGRAMAKLAEWVTAQNGAPNSGPSRLEALAHVAGVKVN